ncbi:MAG: hypothetical protein AAF734_04235 [Bacteroidota bacterium]
MRKINLVFILIILQVGSYTLQAQTTPADRLEFPIGESNFMTLRNNGALYLGTAALSDTSDRACLEEDDYLLFVDGKGVFEEVRVKVSDYWCDYVFAPDYDLMPLPKLKSYIKTHQHLPGIPAASQIEIEGLEIANMLTRQMEKIEELTLYTLQQEAKIQALTRAIEALQQQIQATKD